MSAPFLAPSGSAYETILVGAMTAPLSSSTEPENVKFYPSSSLTVGYNIGSFDGLTVVWYLTKDIVAK